MLADAAEVIQNKEEQKALETSMAIPEGMEEKKLDPRAIPEVKKNIRKEPQDLIKTKNRDIIEMVKDKHRKAKELKEKLERERSEECRERKRQRRAARKLKETDQQLLSEVSKQPEDKLLLMHLLQWEKYECLREGEGRDLAWARGNGGKSVGGLPKLWK